MAERLLPPNHHADYPGFGGVAGWVAALSMVVGRTADARLAARQSDLESGDSVVDLGCGPGVAVRYAARLGATVTGVDPAPVMLRVARLLTRHLPRVRYADGSAESIPLPDGSATVVWSIASVHHWSDLDAALGEVRRVLVSGGRFVAIERSVAPGSRGHASHGWLEEQAVAFRDRCAALGFVEFRVEPSTLGRRPTISVIGRAS